MDAFVSSMMTNILAVAAVFGSVLGFFSWLDKHASAEAKQKIVEWLKKPHQSELNLGNTFDPLFRLVYGTNILSVHGFVRASVVTCILCLLFTLLWALANFQELRGIAFPDITGEFNSDSNLYFSFHQFLGNLVVYILFFSIPCDYITLLFSHLAIQKSVRARSILRAAVLLLCAYIACVLVYYAAFVILTKIHPLTNEGGGIELIWGAVHFETLVIFFSGTGPHEVSGSFGPYLYSSFFALSWFVSFLCTATLLRIIIFLSKSLGVLTWLINVDEHPVTCIGIIAATSIGICYSLFLIVARIA
ncbi:hypothetical protein [Nitrosospira sp. Nsp13]|uniref:hypothetical protein n=1 Tax=Nitrosospira sp. Nsp13 TaxID=1855332 RepID=UPI000885D4E0|nr:hypothetical protein [Nitrosospira sp. Nsp13]SCX87545.1 hypothetical protein SAMN05216308_101673 [Nitrosospira sp. Nsp13]